MSQITLLNTRLGRLVPVVTVAAMLAAVSPAAAPASLAQTTSPEPLSSGAPAPAGFATDLIRVFDQATAVPLPPGADAPLPAVSSSEFRQMVGGLSQDELNLIYGTNPEGWPQVISALHNYTTTVTPLATGAVAAPGQAPAAVPKATPGTAAPSVIFEPTPCPGLAVGGPGGGFYQIYSLNVAKSAVQLTADVLGTEAIDQARLALVAGASAVAAGSITVLAMLGFLTVKTALSLAAAVVGAVAAAMEIPIDVVQYLLNRAIGSCQYNNATAIVPVIDANAVNAQNNVNATHGLSKQNLHTNQAINQLLDTRTQTIVNQLNTAQASLDQDLRHSIEAALAGGNATAIVAYQLPASLGGYLDSTPIGVQGIVTSTLAMMQAANQPIAPAAPGDLASANKALAAGQYKQAFTYYQSAYRLMTR